MAAANPIVTSFRRVIAGDFLGTYSKLDPKEKQELHARVAAAAFAAIGFSLMLGFISIQFLWAVAVVAGLTFVLSTDPAYRASLAQGQWHQIFG